MVETAIKYNVCVCGSKCLKIIDIYTFVGDDVCLPYLFNSALQEGSRGFTGSLLVPMRSLGNSRAVPCLKPLWVEHPKAGTHAWVLGSEGMMFVNAIL